MKPSSTLGLRRQIILLLTIAILPIGAVGVWQAWQMAEDRDRLSDAALLAFAAERASAERVSITAAFSAIDALIAADIHNAPDCAETLAEVVAGKTGFVFGGVTTLDGMLQCRSDGEAPIDLSERPSLRALSAAPRRAISLLEDGAATGLPVAVVTVPIFEAEAELVGFLSLSTPRLGRATVWPGPRGVEREVVSVALDTALQPATGERPEWMPVDLGAIAPAESLRAPRLLRAKTAAGETRSYVLAPVIPGQLYELSAWHSEDGADRPAHTAVVFPLLMWTAALVVAFLALDRLVVRPISTLRRDLKAFGTDRTLGPEGALPLAPEIADCDAAFRVMAARILRDEAQIEDDLREKQLLLQEVHHRVKNNLQILISLVRMHGSAMPDDGSRQVLAQLQDRILAVATTYRQTYQGQSISAVPAPALIDALIAESQVALPPGLLDLEVTKTMLGPEEALGVAMIVSEVLLTLSGADPHSDRARLHIARSEDGGLAVVADLTWPTTEDKPHALARKLIRVFAAQFGGSVEEHPTADGRTTLAIR
ncbi:MAG: sensor histidine kinase [Pseudomonadota bacterium]